MKQVKLEEGDIKRLFKTDTPLGRFWKYCRWAVRQLVYLVALFLFFFFLLNYGAYWKRFRYDLQPKASPAVQPVIQAAPVAAAPLPDYAPEIIISKISVDAPIVLNIAPNDIVPQLANGVVHYQDTALPGEIGNSVLVGHSSDYIWSTGHYKTIFALLDKLSPGDQIVIPYQTQKFTYEVSTVKVVKPTELSVLAK